MGSNRMDLLEIKKTAKLFLDSKTFSFIISQYNHEKRNYNGYIVSLHEDFLVIQDRLIPNPIPLYWEDIIFIDISKFEATPL